LKPKFRRVAGLASLVTVAVVGAGCNPGPPSNGIASDAPIKIFDTAMHLLSTAHSVFLNVQLGTGAGLAEVEATVFANGDASGTIIDNDTTEAKFVRVGANDYIRATASYWVESGLQPGAATSVSNRWVRVADSATNIGSTLSIARIASTALKNLKDWSSSSSTGTFDGQPSVFISSSDTMHGLEVSTTGAADPISLQGTTASGTTSRILFGEWNQGTLPAVPPGATNSGAATRFQIATMTTIYQVVL
jgi:hypothetical protein